MALIVEQILNTSYTDDMTIYVSIFEKPEKAKGRPTTCKMSDEQKKKKNRKNNNIPLIIKMTTEDN